MGVTMCVGGRGMEKKGKAGDLFLGIDTSLYNRSSSIHLRAIKRSNSLQPALRAISMIFRVRKSYSITLKPHNLLGIPEDPPPIIHGQVGQANRISREQIQEAFRKAAKCYHPDILAASGGVDAAAATAEQTRTTTKIDANRTFRECNEARELLLDYYVRCDVHN